MIQNHKEYKYMLIQIPYKIILKILIFIIRNILFERTRFQKVLFERTSSYNNTIFKYKNLYFN